MANLAGFVIRRLLATVVIAYVIVTVVFFLVHASPYNPIAILLGHYATGANLAMYRKEYGLNLPLGQQYLNYLGGLLHGNLGYAEESGYIGDSVSGILQTHLPATLKLGFYGLLVALIVGLPVGLISALRQNSWIDHSGQSVMIVLYVVPAFVFCPLCQLVFGVELHWLPVTGWGTGGWTGPLNLIPVGGSFSEMILPVLIYAAGLAGFFAKSFRSFLLEVLNQDYIRTARAKGLKSRVIIYLHAIKNTLLPLASIVGPTIAYLILGAFIIEEFFGIPGVGQLTALAAVNSDYAVVEGTTLILVIFVIIVNMFTDIFYAVVDPRVKL